jgi:hypothetical protein
MAKQPIFTYRTSPTTMVWYIKVIMAVQTMFNIVSTFEVNPLAATIAKVT